MRIGTAATGSWQTASLRFPSAERDSPLGTKAARRERPLTKTWLQCSSRGLDATALPTPRQWLILTEVLTDLRQDQLRHGIVVFEMNGIHRDFLEVPLFDQKEGQAERVWRFNASYRTGNSTESHPK